jgi:hypothetical protein
MLANFTGVGFAVSAEEGYSSTHFCKWVSFPNNYGLYNSNTYYIDMTQGGQQVTTEGCTGSDEFAIDTEGTGY